MTATSTPVTGSGAIIFDLVPRCDVQESPSLSFSLSLSLSLFLSLAPFVSNLGDKLRSGKEKHFHPDGSGLDARTKAQPSRRCEESLANLAWLAEKKSTATGTTRATLEPECINRTEVPCLDCEGNVIAACNFNIEAVRGSCEVAVTPQCGGPALMPSGNASKSVRGHDSATRARFAFLFVLSQGASCTSNGRGRSSFRSRRSKSGRHCKPS